jgi:hypothetical protein
MKRVLRRQVSVPPEGENGERPVCPRFSPSGKASPDRLIVIGR